MDHKHCTQCGVELIAQAHFCQSCGHPLSAAIPNEETDEPSLRCPPSPANRLGTGRPSKHADFEYVSGIPGLTKTMHVTVLVDDDTVRVRRLGKLRATISLLDVLQIEVKKETELLPAIEKDRSVIGRAIGGGILLGPIGAVAGAMSGIPKKTIRAAKNKTNYFVVVVFKADGLTNMAVLRSNALIFKERAARKLVNEIATRRQQAAQRLRA